MTNTKKIVIAVCCAIGFGAAGLTVAHSEEKDHAHAEEKHGEHEHGEKGHDARHEHDEDGGHAHTEDKHDEDEHGHDGGGVVGPDKGVTAKGPDGFKLSPEALKNFGVRASRFGGALPAGALVKIKDGRFAYRQREGWIKRVTVAELRSGDEVITEGAGFVRTAEIVTEEGVAHGHSH